MCFLEKEENDKFVISPIILAIFISLFAHLNCVLLLKWSWTNYEYFTPTTFDKAVSLLAIYSKKIIKDVCKDVVTGCAQQYFL